MTTQHTRARVAGLTRVAQLMCATSVIGMGLSLAVVAQTPGAARPATTARPANGHPDLSGLYNAATVTPLERPDVFKDKAFATDAEAQKYAKDFLDAGNIDRRDPDPRVDVGRAYENIFLDRGTGMARVRGKIPTSLIVDPADGKIPPMTPEGQKRVAAERAANRPTSEAGEQGGATGAGAYDNPEQRPLAERCLLGFGSTSGPPALPVLYNNFKQVVQTADNVLILNEMVHDVRVVRMNVPHLPSSVRKWMGDSVGRWEGDRLVIDTTNFTDKTSFRGSSANLHVIESISRLDANTLLYRFTVDDPSTWTRPWMGEYPWVATSDPIYEYACHENNYALGNILSGARFQDHEGSEKPKK